MATYVFELEGVTNQNLASVKAALHGLAGMSCTLVMSMRGTWLVFVHSELSEDDVFSAISTALAALGIKVHRTQSFSVAPTKSPKP